MAEDQVVIGNEMEEPDIELVSIMTLMREIESEHEIR